MSAPDDERIDLPTPNPDPPRRHVLPDFLLESGDGTGALPTWLALQGRSLDSLVDDARGGNDEASRLLLKTFVLQHNRGAIDPAILDYVAGCLATITLPTKRMPDPETMSLADVEEAFSLHRPTAQELWEAFHLDRPPGRPETAPFAHEMGDVFLASRIAEERDSGATIGQAWATVRVKGQTNLARVKGAWCRLKNRYPPPAGE